MSSTLKNKTTFGYKLRSVGITAAAVVLTLCASGFFVALMGYLRKLRHLDSTWSSAMVAILLCVALMAAALSLLSGVSAIKIISFQSSRREQLQQPA
jgi:hypothetical protein